MVLVARMDQTLWAKAAKEKFAQERVRMDVICIGEAGGLGSLSELHKLLVLLFSLQLSSSRRGLIGFGEMVAS